MSNTEIKQFEWTKDRASEFWSFLAGTEYLATRTFSRHNSDFLFEIIQPYLSKDAHFLDFGAGAKGYFVAKLLENGYPACGFEPSQKAENPEFLKYPHFLGNLKEGDQRTFDVVMLSEVIEHLYEEDVDGVFNRIRSLLKPGGIFIVTTPNQESLEGSSVLCPSCHSFFHPWQHIRSFTSESLKSFLARYGFESIVTHQVDFSMNRTPIERSKIFNENMQSIAHQLNLLEQEARWPWKRRKVLRRIHEIRAQCKTEFELKYHFSEDRHIGSGNNLVFIGRKK